MFLVRGTIGTVIVLALMSTPPAWASGGYIYESTGDVTIMSGKNARNQAVLNQAINSNTIVVTGNDSHAVIKFEDGQVVAMKSNSAFNVKNFTFEEKSEKKSNILFNNIKGGLLFITGLIGQRYKKSFRLTTPNATIGVRGTEFMVAMEDGILYGKVKSGSISVFNDASSMQFGAGQVLRVSSINDTPVAIPAEELPPGIFTQLEALQLPAAEPGTIPPAAATGLEPAISILDAATLVSGSALISAAAAVAGGGVASSLPGFPSVVQQAGALPPSAMLLPATSDSTPLQPVGKELSEETASKHGKATNKRNKGLPSRPVRSALMWIDDSIPPKNVLPAGSTAKPELLDSMAIGESRLFGRHNFTPDGRATGEICVFCHTPQGLEEEVVAIVESHAIAIERI